MHAPPRLQKAPGSKERHLPSGLDRERSHGRATVEESGDAKVEEVVKFQAPAMTPRRRGAEAAVAVFTSPSFRAERRQEIAPPADATGLARGCALALVVAGFVWLAVAAVSGATWALGIAVLCALIAAPLAALSD